MNQTVNTYTFVVNAWRGMSAVLRKEKEKLALLENLPTELLLVIFKYCSLRALGNVCQTCKRLNSVVSDFIWYGKSQKTLVTNQISADIQTRYCT